ncbi:MAG: glycosyltransferase family 2 protein [Siphonobacter sp.]
MTSQIGSVWAVIVYYKGQQWIQSCLASLRTSIIPVKTILVNNDHPSEMQVIRNEFPEVMILQASENKGFGIANNLGITQALQQGAKYVLLLNQDAWVFPETLTYLTNQLNQNPSYGVVSPLHLTAQQDALDYGFSTYLSPERCQGYVSDVILGITKPIYPLTFTNAAVWLVTRTCYEAIGGFDPVFFMYGEDMDWCYRLQYHGFRMGVVPAAKACHVRNGQNAAKPAKRPFSASAGYLFTGYNLAFVKNINWSVWRGLGMAGWNMISVLLKPQGYCYRLKAAGQLLRGIPGAIASRKECKERKANFLN